MVRMQQRIVARGAGVQFKFADETGFHERMQRVVNGGAGSTGPAFVQRGPEFVDCGMVGMTQQVVEESDSLRRAAQTSGSQRVVDIVGTDPIHHRTRLD